jgi:hypothetical protein
VHSAWRYQPESTQKSNNRCSFVQIDSAERHQTRNNCKENMQWFNSAASCHLLQELTQML